MYASSGVMAAWSSPVQAHLWPCRVGDTVFPPPSHTSPAHPAAPGTGTYTSHAAMAAAASCVSGLAFDYLTESVWMADVDGFLSGFTLPDALPLARTRFAHPCTPSLAPGAASATLPGMGTPVEDAAWGVARMDHPIVPCVAGSGVLVPSGPCVRVYDRGCVLHGLVSADSLEPPSTVAAASATSGGGGGGGVPRKSIYAVAPLDTPAQDGIPATYRAIMGGTLNSVHCVDVSALWNSFSMFGKRRTNSVSRVLVPHVVHHLVQDDRHILAAASYNDSTISLLDPAFRSSRLVGSLNAQMGGVYSMSAYNNLLLCCGITSRHGPRRLGTSLEPMVKVFDVRMHRPLAPLFVADARRQEGPVTAALVPPMFGAPAGSSGAHVPAVVMVTTDGQVLVADAHGGMTPTPLTSFDAALSASERAARSPFAAAASMSRLHLTHAQVSPSRQVIAAADVDGCVHLLSCAPQANASTYTLSLNLGLPFHSHDAWLRPTPATWRTTDVAAPRAEAALAVMGAPAETAASIVRKTLRGGGSAAATPGGSRAAPGSRHAPPSSGSSGGALPPAAAAAFASAMAAARRGGGGNAAAAAAMAAAAAQLGISPAEVLSASSASPAATYDAALWQGAGYEVPVDAPGWPALNEQPSAPWSHVWSRPLAELVTREHADLWFDSLVDRIMPAAVLSTIPALNHFSSMPLWMMNTLLLPHKYNELDPVLVTYANPATMVIDNVASKLNLVPNTLVYGKRKAYVDGDPRHKAAGKSSLGVPPKDAAAAGATAAAGTSERAESVGSVSSEDLAALMAIDIGHDSGDSDSDGDAAAGTGADSVPRRKAGGGASLRAPLAYTRPRLQATRTGMFEFDFSQYNSTPFAGLEEVGPNSFVNAAIQSLFFCLPLRKRLHRHLCTHPACVACELRFLFDILAQAEALPPGERTATAQNLVRALGAVTEFKRVGVLHPCVLSPARRFELFVRTLLDKVTREVTSKQCISGVSGLAAEGAAAAALEDAPASSGSGSGGGSSSSKRTPVQPNPDDVFAYNAVSVVSCPAGHVTRREARSVMLDLVAPEEAAAATTTTAASFAPATMALSSSGGSGSHTFASLMQTSLSSLRRTRAWCDECKAYVVLTQQRTATSLPQTLCVNVADVDSLQRVVGTPSASSAVTTSVGAKISPRLHVACSNHVMKGVPPVPHVHVTEAEAGPPTLPAYERLTSRAEYQLVGAVYHIVERSTKRAAAAAAAQARRAGAGSATPSAGGAGGLVQDAFHYVLCAAVTEGGEYDVSAATMDGAAPWLVFNDFRVTPTSLSEVVELGSCPWRTPCMLLYQQREATPAGSLASPGVTSPTGVDAAACTAGALLRRPASMATDADWVAARARAGYLFPDVYAAPRAAGHVMRIAPDVVFALPPSIPHQPALGSAPTAARTFPLPRRGEVVAIDAEFVAVSTEKSRILPNGTRQVLEPAIFAPGRASVVDTATHVVLDQYIASMEPVLDHLTRFSGISPGDLDPQTSRHRLHTFKDTYMKLRSLVDEGVVFVGHGMRKDCRTLNLYIPRAQTVDTVNIYKLEGHRNLSLKFLAYHVLSVAIQGVVHDSHEDAFVTLRLYEYYRDMREESGEEAFHLLVQRLYDIGRSTGFKAVAAPEGSSSSSSGLRRGGAARETSATASERKDPFAHTDALPASSASSAHRDTRLFYPLAHLLEASAAAVGSRTAGALHAAHASRRPGGVFMPTGSSVAGGYLPGSTGGRQGQRPVLGGSAMALGVEHGGAVDARVMAGGVPPPATQRRGGPTTPAGMPLPFAQPPLPVHERPHGALAQRSALGAEYTAVSSNSQWRGGFVTPAGGRGPSPAHASSSMPPPPPPLAMRAPADAAHESGARLVRIIPRGGASMAAAAMGRGSAATYAAPGSSSAMPPPPSYLQHAATTTAAATVVPPSSASGSAGRGGFRGTDRRGGRRG